MSIAESLSGVALLSIVLSILLCYIASTAIYRLIWDPLAKFPGPKLAAITRYYEAYYDVIQNGQYTNKIDQLHKQYGPIIRISPYELHIQDSAFYGQLYRQDGNWERYEWMIRGFAAGPRSTFSTISHNLHRKRRAPLDVFFSKANVTRRQDIIKARVDRLCRRISDAAVQEDVFDLGDALAATGTDIATQYILGKSFNNLDRIDFNMPMTNMIKNFGGMWRTTKHVTFLAPILLAMPLNVLEKISGEESKEFVTFLRNNQAHTEAEIANANLHETKSDDGFDTMVQSILKSRQLPPSEKGLDRVRDEVDATTGAGIETVGQTLRLICFHIYDNPKILQRLRDELTGISQLLGPNATSAEGRPILSQLERLPYLTAVIKEGLRMSPGIATRMARIAPDREIHYGSYSIPAGTPVGMTVLLMHYDEKQYPDPQTFSPERWLNSGSKTQGEKVFAPFGRGARMCVGMHLAYAELYMVIATLVTNFDIKFVNAKAEDLRPRYDSFTIGTEEKHGPKARAVLLS